MLVKIGVTTNKAMVFMEFNVNDFGLHVPPEQAREIAAALVQASSFITGTGFQTIVVEVPK